MLLIHYYYLIDHSNFHGSTTTTKLLSDFFPKMLNALPKNMQFYIPTISKEATKLFNLLLRLKDIADVRTVIEEEKLLKGLPLI
ncbi:unnamed protein product [Rhizophagus irregularis]|nr:unnamed protein product [Rhizophagus irregularis]